MRYLVQAGAFFSAVALLVVVPATAQITANPDLVAEGKQIFETGVGGLACTVCHGPDQTTFVAPDITGGSVERVHAALASVEAMESLRLTPPQMVAVAAYLQSQALPPPAVQPSDLIAQGREIYVSSPGHVGCVECHGHDQTILIAPDLTGTNVAQVHAVIGEIEQMEGLILSPPQMVAVSMYLGQLGGR